MQSESIVVGIEFHVFGLANSFTQLIDDVVVRASKDSDVLVVHYQHHGNKAFFVHVRTNVGVHAKTVRVEDHVTIKQAD